METNNDNNDDNIIIIIIPRVHYNGHIVRV